jgi:hypothetical protein
MGKFSPANPTARAQDGNHGAGQGSKQVVPKLRQKILMSVFRFRASPMTPC